MQPVKVLRSPSLWGVGAMVVIAVLALVTSLLYISPPGQKIVTFYTDDASSVRSGDAVRIAGITVGKVKDLSLDSNRVRVNATVDGNAFVGEQSQVEVRMLTVVGGYYVNIVSLGDEPLGDKAIPLERVTMPYSLIETLTDATTITEQVNATSIRESLDKVQQGLTGMNVDSLSAIIEAGNSLTTTIEKQRGQISAILNLSDEYIQALSNFGSQLKEIISKVAIIEQTLVLYGKGFAGALMGLGDIGDAITSVGPFYLNHRDKFIEKIRNWQEIFRTWADRNGVVVQGLRRVRDKLDRVLDAQNAQPELLATNLCIPMPGSPC
jgi:phospholipid/cholesterol/gamma-HCH transport system substrate-binding protein